MSFLTMFRVYLNDTAFLDTKYKSKFEIVYKPIIKKSLIGCNGCNFFHFHLDSKKIVTIIAFPSTLWA